MPAYAIQFARPDAEEGQWTGSFTDIDEPIRNDFDYVSSKELRQRQSDEVNFSLSDVVHPPERDHIVRYAFKEDNKSVNSPYLVVRLKQGGTVIDSWTENSPLPIYFTGASHMVLPEKIKLISDYNDLKIEFEAICDISICPSTATPLESVSISWAELQVPSLNDVPRPPPTILGVGFYKIATSATDKSLTPDKQYKSGFEEFIPYSKQADISDKQNYGRTGSYEKRGTFFKIDDKKTSTFLGQTNQPIQLQVQIQDFQAGAKVEHLSLFADIISSSSSSIVSNIELSFEKGKPLYIRDKDNLLSSAKAFSSLEDGFLWVNFDLIFQKPLKKSDIILQAWNEFRIPSYGQILDAWDISESIESKPQEITLTKEVIVSHDASSPLCKVNDSCFIPFEAKVLKNGIVTWINNDDSIHTIVSGNPQYGSLNIFDGVLMPGKVYQKQFKMPGTFKYFCDIHPWATGVVTVYENDVASGLEYTKKSLLVSTSTSHGALIIENNDRFISKNRDLNLIVSGNLEGVTTHKMIVILIKKPDGSTEKVSAHTNDKGYFFIPVKLAKKWTPGLYEIISSYNNAEFGHITFNVSE